MRGEYFSSPLGISICRGSPPLARGIQVGGGGESGYSGITPACAGNTKFVPVTQIVLRDHPRLRGEYNDWNTDKATEQGSPPLARGIPLYLSDEDKEMGITPACAGNTTMEATLQLGIRDHPRLRGEYIVVTNKRNIFLGSPPLARGILSF